MSIPTSSPGGPGNPLGPLSPVLPFKTHKFTQIMIRTHTLLL